MNYHILLTYRFFSVICCLFFLLFCGCEKETIGHKEEEVCFNLELTANSNFNIVTRTAVSDSSFAVPEAEDFKIQIFNTAGELLKEWGTYSQVPHPVKIQTGRFQIKASHGNPEKSGFECPAFAGDTTVQLLSASANKGIRENRIALSAKFANVLASVRYRESLKTHYEDYNTQIITSHDTITFNKDEERIAFFPVEDLKVVVNLTKHDSTTYSIPATTLTQTKAAEFYRLYVDVEGGSGYEKLLLSFDSTTIENPIEIELSQNWQSRKIPYLSPSFDTTKYHSFIMGEDCEEGTFYTLITAVGKIGSCKIKTNSRSLINAGWPAEVDLLNLTSANRDRLEKFGFTWPKNMANVNMAELDFSGIVSHLPSADHVLTVEVADIYGQVSALLPIRFRIIPPEFKLLPPEQPAIIRSLEYAFEIQMNGGNPDNIIIEYLNNYPEFGVTEWTPCEIRSREWNDTQDKVLLHTKINMNKTSIQFRAKYDKKITDEVTLQAAIPIFQLHKEYPEWAHRVKFYIQQTDGTNGLLQNSTAEEYFIETSEDGNEWTSANHKTSIDKLIKLQAVDLKDGQTYYVRAGFDTKTDLGICYSDPITIETEAATQLPNAGMEDWHYTRPNGVQYWEVYYACKDGEIPAWNTMNELTTSEGGKNTSVASNRNGCRYSANSGTLRTDKKYKGDYAALIRTVGWGSDNGAYGSTTIPTTLGGGKACKNLAPGQLYLGTYDVNNKKPVYGHPFTSRPDTLKFYYKYIPKNQKDYGYVEIKILDHNGKTLASNSKELTRQDIYSVIELPLDYDDISVKAASMYIVFKSSANSACQEINDDNLSSPSFGNTSNGEFLGSQLYIDDIELIYE